MKQNPEGLTIFELAENIYESVESVRAKIKILKDKQKIRINGKSLVNRRWNIYIYVEREVIFKEGFVAYDSLFDGILEDEDIDDIVKTTILRIFDKLEIEAKIKNAEKLIEDE